MKTLNMIWKHTSPSCALVVLFLALLAPLGAQAQQAVIRLIDQQSREKITEAYFQYGQQSGYTNQQGEITISPATNTSLIVNHLQYGEKIVSPEQVQQAIESGKLMLEQQVHLLQPVVYMQVHSNAGESQNHEFQSADLLNHDAGQLLSQFSGISAIRKSGAYGFDPVIRGFKYDQVNLVIDGVQGATAGCPNRMDPSSSQIPMNMINQAEILKGPHSLRYGNAFGGTVNFKSGGFSFTDSPNLSGRLSSGYESNGNIWRSEALGNYTNQFADLKLFGAYSSGEDYKAGNGETIAANFNRRNLGGKLGLKLSEGQQISAMVANNYAEDVDFPTLPMDLREDNTWLFNLGHQATFQKHQLKTWETRLYATKVNHVMDNYDKQLQPRMADAITQADTKNFGGRTELRFDFDHAWLYAGADLRVEKASGERQRSILMGPMAGMTMHDNVWQDAEILKSGIFAEYHLPGENYQLIFSGRLEYNRSDAKDPDSDFSALYGDELSSELVNPAFSVGGTHALGANLSTGLWFGLAQRSPGLSERYINYFPIGVDPYEMVGNPDLDAETNKQIDWVLSWDSKQTTIKLNAFAAFIGNYISSEIRDDLTPRMASAPGVRQFINLDHALHTGFEFSWQQQLFPFLQQQANLAYTYGENKDSGEALPEIPPMEFQYRLSGSFLQDKLQAEIAYRHSFKQDRIATSFGENTTPAFDVVDLKARYQLNRIVSISGGVNNVLDEAYYEHLSRNIAGTNRPLYSPGRSFAVSLAFNFL